MAILSVVLYHARPAILPGGFVGVDVFFVISGFLISRIILDHLERGDWSFVEFYGRRIRRIFPALAVVLLVTLGAGFVVLLPSELARLGQHVAAGSVFVSNLVLWHEAGYFDRAASYKPLLHLWSLAIEEQFYLVWPLVLYVVSKSRVRPLFALAAVSVGSFAFNGLVSADDATAAFYSPLARVWELSLGGMLARGRLPSSPTAARIGQASSPRLNDLASVAGLCLIVGSAVFVDEQRFHLWSAALLSVTGALLLIAVGPVASANRLLSTRAAVLVGRISYPLYLWHWPLICMVTIVRRHPPRPALAAGLIAVSAALAWLTYSVVEKPFRSGIHPGRKTTMLAVVMMLIGATGAWTWWTAASRALDPAVPHVDVAKIDGAIGDGVFRPTKDMSVERIDKITIATIGTGPEAVLFAGDSVVLQYGPRVQKLFDDGRLAKTVYFVAGPSCSPIPGAPRPDIFARCSAMSRIVDELVAAKHIGTIVLGAFWSANAGEGAFVERMGIRTPITTPDTLDQVYANLADYIRTLEHTRHETFLILSPPISDRFDPQTMISRSWTEITIDLSAFEGTPIEALRGPVADANRRLSQVSEETGAKLLDPFPDICGAGPRCSAFFGEGEPKFADAIHLRPAFVREHVTFLDHLLTAPRSRP